MTTLHDIATHLNGVHWRHDGSFMALCPYHDDNTCSLHVGPGYGFKCHGCGQRGNLDVLKEYLGVTDLTEYSGRRPVTNRQTSLRASGSTVTCGAVVAHYVYEDEDGCPLYRVTRYSPKNFMIQRWDDGWKWGLRGTRRVLYKLPELIRRKDETIIIVEGEKDANRLYKLEILATTFAGGVNSWGRTDTRCCDGRDVCLIPDNDDAGKGQFQALADHLCTTARTVNVVRLRGLSEHGDVSDWLEQGHTKEELIELCL